MFHRFRAFFGQAACVSPIYPKWRPPREIWPILSRDIESVDSRAGAVRENMSNSTAHYNIISNFVLSIK